MEYHLSLGNGVAANDRLAGLLDWSTFIAGIKRVETSITPFPERDDDFQKNQAGARLYLWAWLLRTLHQWSKNRRSCFIAVSYTHLRAHETRHDLVCRLLL